LKKYIVFTDCHKFGADPSPNIVFPKTREEVIATNSISIGDNFDLYNAPKKEVENCRKERDEHYRIFGNSCVSGNHDLETDTKSLFKIVDDHILISHGDVLFWGMDMAMSFRSKKAGSVYLYRVWARAVSKFRTFTGAGMSEKNIMECVKAAKAVKCDVVVTGHRHCKHMIVAERDGVTVINLPRGRNEVYL
jgi:predicted phosphodiesterase